jgi:hypothetical protein
MAPTSLTKSQPALAEQAGNQVAASAFCILLAQAGKNDHVPGLLLE